MYIQLHNFKNIQYIYTIENIGNIYLCNYKCIKIWNTYIYKELYNYKNVQNLYVELYN
jgi:hypothetical protein